MKLYFLDVQEFDPKYCFAEGASIYDTRLMRGGAVLAEMAEEKEEFLTYKLDEEQGGLLVGDCISNTDSHLLVSRKCADAIVGSFKTGPTELVPIRIINEKGRVHAKDAVVLHPIEPVDCLDWKRSDIDEDDDYPMVRIFGNWMLKKSAVPPDLDLMRVKGSVNYIFSERLVSFIKKRGFTNFPFGEVKLS